MSDRVARPLPIDPLLPGIVEALSVGTRLVLRAAPGAGKTTRVPAALLDAGIGGGKQVIVLEPRRIAARAAAEFVAAGRGTPVGGEVGYRVRFETRGSERTRLWFQTEGIFSRDLLRDPFLEHAGVVVLDEFHERHLQGDLALGVVLELQETVRPDLRLLVMSATLETGPLARALGDCPVLTSEGRTFPVEVVHDEEDPGRRMPERIAAALHAVASCDDGDVLVFLPGAAAIRRTEEAIAGLAADRGFDVVTLHGDLPLEAQRRAIERGPKRRVVLSTNVAETALTVEGVTTVIDSGLAREARFDPRHGLNRLEEVRISRAAAEQRAGRAGRTRPGRCLRLWSRADHEGRREREAPEVLRLDLAATVLELRAIGQRDPREFRWLDPPPAAPLERAERLLAALGAIDANGGVTSTGRRMLELSVAPRLARILVEAERRGCAEEAAIVAALASERDIRLDRRALSARGAPRWPSGPSDLLLCLELFHEAERLGFDRGACESIGLESRSARTVERVRRQLAASVRGGGRSDDPEALLRSVVAGFPDRVVRRRGAGSPRGVMVGGRGIVLDPESVVREEELFVAVDVEAGPRGERSEARVRAASAVRREWLEELAPGALRATGEIAFDSGSGRVVERRRELYGDLVLSESLDREVDPAIAGEALLREALRDPDAALSLGDEEVRFLERLRFLQRAMPELAWSIDAAEMPRRLLEWASAGKRSLAELRDCRWLELLRGAVTFRETQILDREAPSDLVLPSGRRAAITYDRDKPPAVAARIQELFGLSATPRLAGGRVPLVIEILAPNQRPVQVTDDLASFWSRTYPEVRKQLRGRYPKHSWPESPLEARPESRPRRR